MTDTYTPFFQHLRSKEAGKEIWNVMRDHKKKYADEIANEIFNLNWIKTRELVRSELSQTAIQLQIDAIVTNKLSAFDSACEERIQTGIAKLTKENLAEKFQKSHEDFLAEYKRKVIAEHEEWVKTREVKLQGLEGHATFNTIAIIGTIICLFCYKK